MAENDIQNGSVPWSEDAESGVLSCFLQNPEVLLSVAAGMMKPEWFYHVAHRRIYEVMQELHQAGKPVDNVSMSCYFMDRNELDKVGGPARMAELLAFVPTPAQFEYYTKILREKWLLRWLQSVCVERVKKIAESPEAVEELITQHEADAFDVVAALKEGITTGRTLNPMDMAMSWFDHMEETFRSRGRITGITTGLVDLDRTMHGLNDKEGEIIVTAGRPGMGKTALGTSKVTHLGLPKLLDRYGRLSLERDVTTGQVYSRADRDWQGGVPGAVFSIEMSENQFMDRVMHGAAMVSGSKAYTGMYSREELQSLGMVSELWKRSNVHVNASPGLTTAELRLEVQTLKRQHGIRWIMVDHLHLLKPVSPQGLKEERSQLVEAMQTLQFLKKQYKLVVFLMVQLSRESDRNPGKPPVLADLSGSAAIEQYADHVVFVHRPAYYKPYLKLSEDEQTRWAQKVGPMRRQHPVLWSDGSECDGNADMQDYNEHAVLYVRKNRRGPTPDIGVRFQGQFTRFSSRTPALYSNKEEDRQQG